MLPTELLQPNIYIKSYCSLKVACFSKVEIQLILSLGKIGVLRHFISISIVAIVIELIATKVTGYKAATFLRKDFIGVFTGSFQKLFSTYLL